MDFNEILRAILLGLIQGFTEFLPVSSSGHLLLAEKLGLLQPNRFFNVVLHLGTLLSVLIVYFKKLTPLIAHPIKSKLGLYAAACVPTGVIALLMDKFFTAALDGAYIAVGFMATAVALFAAEAFYKNRKSSLDYCDAVLCGTAQGIAVLPAVSRSGATISTLMLLGVDKQTAADFSFILSVPIILLSAVYEGVKLNPSDFSISWAAVFFGFLAAFLSGLAAIKLFLRVIKSRTFLPFTLYLTALSIISLAIL